MKTSPLRDHLRNNPLFDFKHLLPVSELESTQLTIVNTITNPYISNVTYQVKGRHSYGHSYFADTRFDMSEKVVYQLENKEFSIEDTIFINVVNPPIHNTCPFTYVNNVSQLWERLSGIVNYMCKGETGLNRDSNGYAIFSKMTCSIKKGRKNTHIISLQSYVLLYNGDTQKRSFEFTL